MSGDMNTGLGNCLIASGLVKCFCDTYNITAELLNNGDDCVLIVEQEQLHLLDNVRGWFLQMGFDMVVEEPVYDLEKVVFCQSQFVEINGKYRMVRQPSICTAKDSVCIRPFPSHDALRKWIHVVGDGGLSLCAGVPVLQSYYAALKRNGIVPGHKLSNDPLFETGARRMARGMSNRTTPITARSRESFYVAFNITPDEQVCLEDYYSRYQLINDGKPGVYSAMDLLM
jgi:hypothetical protein